MLDLDSDAIQLMFLSQCVCEAVLAVIAVKFNLIQEFNGLPLWFHPLEVLATIRTRRAIQKPFIDTICAKVSLASNVIYAYSTNCVVFDNIEAYIAFEFFCTFRLVFMCLRRNQFLVNALLCIQNGKLLLLLNILDECNRPVQTSAMLRVL